MILKKKSKFGDPKTLFENRQFEKKSPKEKRLRVIPMLQEVVGSNPGYACVKADSRG